MLDMGLHKSTTPCLGSFLHRGAHTCGCLLDGILATPHNRVMIEFPLISHDDVSDECGEIHGHGEDKGLYDICLIVVSCSMTI